MLIDGVGVLVLVESGSPVEDSGDRLCRFAEWAVKNELATVRAHVVMHVWRSGGFVNRSLEENSWNACA